MKEIANNSITSFKSFEEWRKNNKEFVRGRMIVYEKQNYSGTFALDISKLEKTVKNIIEKGCCLDCKVKEDIVYLLVWDTQLYIPTWEDAFEGIGIEI